MPNNVQWAVPKIRGTHTDHYARIPIFIRRASGCPRVRLYHGRIVPVATDLVRCTAAETSVDVKPGGGGGGETSQGSTNREQVGCGSHMQHSCHPGIGCAGVCPDGSCPQLASCPLLADG